MLNNNLFYGGLHWFQWHSHVLATYFCNWMEFGDKPTHALKVIDQGLLLKVNYIQRLSLNK